MPLKAKNYSLHNGPLTDDAIFTYCLSGTYGTERQLWAESQLRRIKSIKRMKLKHQRTSHVESKTAEQTLQDLGL